MATSFLPVSDHRFKKSPFFACNDRPETRYGIYNRAAVPDQFELRPEVTHYQHLKTLRLSLRRTRDTAQDHRQRCRLNFLQQLFTRNVIKN